MKRLAALLATAMLVMPAAAHAAPASQPDIEDEVMCVTCNIPLNVAESPQADRQKAIIRREIDRGQTKDQIKATLVAEYGDDVLGLPDEDGFGITAYAVPAGLIGGLVATVVFFVPRWRRRAGRSGPDVGTGSSLTPADTRRLDDELARYDA